jgi:peptidoglycan/xylan/chitin deacetylase (PgdA/CDA1 family)
MLISARMLERQLDWVARRFRIVSLDELGARLAAGAPAGHMAAVTFDDGYRDVYEHAFPLLKRKGIPAAVFVVTDLVGTSALQFHDRLHLLLARALSRAPQRWSLARLLQRAGVTPPVSERAHGPADPIAMTTALLTRVCQADLVRVAGALEEDDPLTGAELEAMAPLSWDMLAEMARHGIAIGSHTASHALLPNETTTDRLRQTAASRQALRRRLGIEARHFAYPSGAFDRESVEAVRAAGYDFGYTTCRHRDPGHALLTIPRTLLWERSAMDGRGEFSPSLMGCLANGLLPLASRCRERHDGPATSAARAS